MSEAWREAKRILCVRLDAFGDVLMTGPALRAVKNLGARITLLTSSSGAEAAKLMPYVDEILLYEAPWMKAANGAHESQLLEMAQYLRSLQFDAAVIFTVYTQSALPAALLCFLAGIPLRLAHCRENPYALLTHWVLDPEPLRLVRHEAARHLALLETVGFATEMLGIEIAIPATARASMALKLAAKGVVVGKHNWIVVHAGATASSRRYAPEKFAEAASMIGDLLGATIVFTGTAGESGLIEEIRRSVASHSISLAGELDTADLAALIQAAPLLISNNTGPAHLAAAVGTPVVVLYALTNPQHTPWRVASRVLFHDVPCRYCYKSVCPKGHGNCLALVSPGQVVAAALDLLANPKIADGSVLPVLNPIPSVAAA